MEESLPLDIFIYLSLFCDIKTFLNLTMCSKKLIQLIYENTIWSTLIKRDFSGYKSHPNYNIERYKKCMRRKRVNYLENSNELIASTLGPFYDMKFKLVYICELFPELENLLNLQNWGMEYEGRFILSQLTSMILIIYLSIILDKDTLSCLKLASTSIEYCDISDKNLSEQYNKKSQDMIIQIVKEMKNMGFPLMISPDRLDIIKKIKNHPNIENIKNILLEHGFN
jgi:hypothetical protein